MNFIEIPMGPEPDSSNLTADEFKHLVSDAEDLEKFFRTTPIGEGKLKCTLSVAIIDGVGVTDYESIVVSRFQAGEDFCIGTADGHYVNVSKFVRELIAYAETRTDK